MNENFINALVILKSIIDSVGTIQTAWGLIVLLVLTVLFILGIFTFTNRVNKSTESQIQRFKKEGKYLPSVYVELNNSMESLRYFIFSYRWKRRIIRQYNHLFSSYEGKRLKQLPIFTAKCRLSYFSSLSKLKSTLYLVSNQLDELRKDHKELYDKYGDVIWAISNSTYNYIYAIKYLQDLCTMVSQKNMVLVGSAGNGKTSLLCRMAEVAISNKIPCMLVNSRDITEDCAEYIIKKLPIHPKLRHLTSLYLALTSIMLFFQRKYFYIFVDAINENDREIFVSSISTLLETFSKYPRIRILLTCRREYFDSRYKTLFSADEERPYIPYIFNLHESEYDRRATRKLIEAYMEHFNVRGPFSLETRKKLSNSLLLTRIFFEVNNNKNECMLEFRNAEIYKLYFEETAVKSKGVNLYSIVNSIAVYMFAEFQFDKIPIEKLNLSEDELNSLKGLLDNNLIISRSVYAGTGITEREEEYVYFVFDELRDFCLARYLLTLDETKASSEYATFFSNVTRLFEHRLSPTEGIVKYAYHYFRTIARDDLCEKILEEFGESDVQSILDQENYGLDSQTTFNNFGFSLIFSEGDNIASFEMNYMLRCEIIKQCKGRVFQIALGGAGDPNKHEFFADILRITSENRIVPNYTTSGYNLTDREIELTKEYCGAVAVSYYSKLSEDKNEDNPSTIEAIERFVEAGCTTNVHYVLSKKNILEAIYRVKNGVFPKGINAVVFLLYKPIGLASKEHAIDYGNPDYLELLRLVTVTGNNWNYGFDTCQSPALYKFASNVATESIEFCEAARFSMYINSRCVAFPCSFGIENNAFSVDLKQYTLQEAWDSECFSMFRKQQTEMCANCTIGVCRSCGLGIEMEFCKKC